MLPQGLYSYPNSVAGDVASQPNHVDDFVGSRLESVSAADAKTAG